MSHGVQSINEIVGSIAGEACGGRQSLLPGILPGLRTQTFNDVGSDNANRLCPAAPVITFVHSQQVVQP